MNILNSILSHSSVIEKQQIYLSNLAKVEEVKSGLFPSITFSTSGGYSIIGNYSKNNSRTKKLSGDYIDGTIRGSQILYDSDVTVLRAKSEINNSNASLNEYEVAKNSIIYNFIIIIKINL